MAALVLTFESFPSPLKDPPRSLTTTLAPRDPKKVAYALPNPPPAPVTTTTWPSNLNWPAILYRHWLLELEQLVNRKEQYSNTSDQQRER